MKISKLGTDFVNVWYIEHNETHIVIDTGYDTDWAIFCRNLSAAGGSLEDIDWIFLTHAHDDHVGFINELLENTHATAIASAKALEGLRRGQNAPGGGAPDQDAMDLCMKMVKEGRGAHRYPHIKPELEKRFLWVDDNTRPFVEQYLNMEVSDESSGIKQTKTSTFAKGSFNRAISDEDGQTRKSRKWHIVDVPGHTEDSIALLADTGEMFVGDAAQNGDYTNDYITIWIGDKEQYVRSWEKIIDSNAVTIYPGHGEPFPKEKLEESMSALNDRTLIIPGSKSNQESI